MKAICLPLVSFQVSDTFLQYFNVCSSFVGTITGVVPLQESANVSEQCFQGSQQLLAATCLSLNLALRSGELLEFWKPTFWLNFKRDRVIGKCFGCKFCVKNLFRTVVTANVWPRTGLVETLRTARR